MWILTVAITLATCIVCIFIWDGIKLGAKSLCTWKFEKIIKLWEENGIKAIFWTIAIFAITIHSLHVVVLWLGTILWTLGVWEP